MLARALALPTNLLVLDEPTNDLDLETLDLLQELLADYKGTVILVSHDRDFLDRVATSVLVAEGDGRWTRICRRLFRHGGAARAGPFGAAPVLKPRAGKPIQRRRPPRRPSRSANCPSRKSTRSKPCRRGSKSCAPRRRGTRPCWPTPIFTRATGRKFTAATEALANATAELAKAEDDWLALEILREEIEGIG